jgi:Zn-dependent peptidase ImmA (M78 family)
MAVWKEDVFIVLPDGTTAEPVFKLRPDYSADELEQRCDCEIQRAKQRRGTNPDLPPTEDDISDILESSGADLNSNAEFSPELGYVQGETQFRPDGIFVGIRAGLPDNPRKSTQAHECGHVLTLKEPYELEGNLRNPFALLFRGNQSPRNWMERAADECMGALLMPERHLWRYFGKPPEDPEKRLAADSSGGQDLIRKVAAMFQCSLAAARVRLLKKRYLVGKTQRSFDFEARRNGKFSKAQTQSPFDAFQNSQRPSFQASTAPVACHAVEQLFLF